MRVLLKERNLALFCGSTIVSLLGDWALMLALPFFVYDRTHSVLSTGAMVTAQLLPRLLFSPFAGVLADRWDRRTTLVATNLFRGLLVLAILVPATGGPIAVIYAVALLEASAAQLFVAAEGALLPTIVPREHLLAANSVLTTGSAAVRLVGPPLGGLLYASLGLGTAAVVDSVSFALAAFVMAGIRVRAAERPAAEAAEERPRFVTALADGVRYLGSNRVLQLLCLTLGMVMVTQGMLETLLVPFVRDVLGFDAPRLGIIAAAEGLGALVGALATGAVSRHLTSGRVLGGGLVLASAFLAAFTMARPLAVSALFTFLMSVPVVVAAVWIQTYYQQRVDAGLLGRVLGLTETTSAIGILIGAVAASTLSARLGIVSLLFVSAGVLLVVGVAALVALWSERTTTSEPEPAGAGLTTHIELTS